MDEFRAHGLSQFVTLGASLLTGREPCARKLRAGGQGEGKLVFTNFAIHDRANRVWNNSRGKTFDASAKEFRFNLNGGHEYSSKNKNRT